MPQTSRETILTEVVANALDSGATRIRLLTDSPSAALTVVDDGRGMQRRELARYHDIAASPLEIDGRALAAVDHSVSDRVPIAIRIGQRRTPSAIGYIERHGFVPADRKGVAISTFGKVIIRSGTRGATDPTAQRQTTVQLRHFAGNSLNQRPRARVRLRGVRDGNGSTQRSRHSMPTMSQVRLREA